ncbi:phage tail tube protein [Hyphomicrobium sp. ghe19]|uniref:phage tail tube protein n=1 Tax=Hyphomicrobium sp. ghe19 TaxID=2682968 RepID=UPI001366AD35|nr:hypothetical protein HYPP_03768 [Hyphomicrobium sp. ghe19]
MTDSNRTRLAVCRETSLGVTPENPVMRAARHAGETLQFQPTFITSDEIRSDRMSADPIKVNETNQGAVNIRLSYPVDESPLSLFFESLMFQAWTNTPFRDNAGTADSAITAVTAEDGVFTVVAGAAFTAGHLVKTSGFANAGNNGLFVLKTGSATVPAVGDDLLTDEAAPPENARIKVVGFQGAAGDIQAAADAITSTALDLSALGIVPGQWIKVGGFGAAYRFATAAVNAYARVIGVAAHKLTLDNLPMGWAVDNGAGKTIRVFFGDHVKNGVDRRSLTIERGFLAQAVPSYIIQRGMVVAQGELTWTTEEMITGSVTFNGLTGELTTVPLDASPLPATTAPIMSANVNVGRIAESGVAVAGPNYVKSASVTVNNNLRMISAVGHVGAVDIGVGECAVTGTLETYFGDKALAEKLLDGTVGNINLRSQKDGQAVIVSLPRVTFTEGSPSAGAKNQDVMLPLNYQASMDSLTNAHVLIDRLEYVEN